MSRKFQKKNKDLVKLKVITSNEAWDKTVKRKGKPTLSKKYKFFGRIDKGTSAMITSTNMYLKSPRKLPVSMFSPHNKDLSMPEDLRQRYDKNNYKEKPAGENSDGDNDN